MKEPPGKGEDQDNGVIFGMHPGDLGVVAIAALCTVAFLLVLFTPSPFAKLEKMQAQAAKEQLQAAKVQRQKDIAKAVASGEINVSIGSGHP
jgi:hypothetical protein